MRIKFRYWFIAFLLFYGSNSPFIYSSISENSKEKSNAISIDYLKKLPSNDYIIGPGDQLNIVISRNYPELNSIVTVDAQGTIYLPKLRRIFVEGLSLNELCEILNKAFLKFVKYPALEIQVLTYRPIKVFVDGEVSNPGLITMSGSMSFRQSNPTDLNSQFKEKGKLSFNEFSNSNPNNNYFPTVFDAIRESGGITEYSDLSNIQIIRKATLSSGSDKVTALLNLENALISGDNSQNIRIYNSDIIRVKKSDKPNKTIFSKAILSNLNSRFLNVYVFGRVNNPGYIKVSRMGTLSDAIDIAGGAKVIKGPLTFVRFNNNGTIDKRKFNFKKNAKRGSFKNPLLEDGDFIVVGNSPISSANEIITEVTNPFVGIFSTYSLIKAVTE